MEWVHYQDQSGFSFDHPAGWKVEVTPLLSCIVNSPDGLWFALIQPMPIQEGASDTDLFLLAQFPTKHLFPDSKPMNVVSNQPRTVEGVLKYRAVDGSAGHAQLVFVNYGEMGLLCAIAAPEAVFESAVPTISRILRSQNQGAQIAATVSYSANMSGKGIPPSAMTQATANAPSASRPAAMAVLGPFPTSLAAHSVPPPLPKPIQYVKYTDPQRGTFVVDAPAGWHMNGGFHHPGLGDRRAWFEANSPEGIYILNDPIFPQALCHMWGGLGGSVVPVGAGGMFLNLKPGAETSADCYIKQTSAKRLRGFVRTQRRPRPDVVEWIKPMVAASGAKIGRKGQISAIETIFERKQAAPALAASLLTTCVFNGDYGVGTGFWNSNNILCVSPAHLANHAENIRTHMARSMQFTPAMFQIVQQDENQVYANAQAQNAAQWSWFGAQQAQHNAQTAFGDSIVNNYWSTQAANDSMIRGWEQNQAVYDRLSQDRSDEMLDKQRLFDDATGKQYKVPAGSNYYWLNPQTDQIIGTETNQPPDYQNNYTELRKP